MSTLVPCDVLVHPRQIIDTPVQFLERTLGNGDFRSENIDLFLVFSLESIDGSLRFRNLDFGILSKFALGSKCVTKALDFNSAYLESSGH